MLGRQSSIGRWRVSANCWPSIVGCNALEDFNEYVESIHQLAQPGTRITPRKWRTELRQCLDGGPNRVLRLQPEQSELKQQGAYFTGTKLATRVAIAATDGARADTLYYDPACGAGDLLLAIARTLPLATTFQETLDDWGRCLAGCDISADFVRLAKTRLTLLAAKRCGLSPPLDLATSPDPFPSIINADSLSPFRQAPNVDVIVMNPPFAYANAPEDCHWASGRINLAALFVARALHHVRAGTRIVAILPDVLRSGSRYVPWRAMTRASGSILAERSMGLFDRWTDVDVYLLHVLKTATRRESELPARPATKRPGGVGRRFKLHVGPVVPHRHAETGPLVPYLHARSIPPWTECSEIQETRRFDGRLFQPPFVTIRRTSRPDNGKRAVATLVLGNRAVAIENHLVVCLPRDGTPESCRELIRRLRSPKADDWLNEHLRCRHLTTRLLGQMPWWYKP